MKSDLEYGNYRGAGMGGSFRYNSTVAYTATAGKKKINLIQVHLSGSPVIEELEDEDGDCLAAYNLTNGTALSPGEVVGARRDKPFVKIKFSTAAPVTLWQD